MLQDVQNKFELLKFKLNETCIHLGDFSHIFSNKFIMSFVWHIEQTYIGATAVATGWGTLKEDGKPSCILQEVEVPIMSNNNCVENTNYTQKMITENMLCAGYPGVGKKDSCQVSRNGSHGMMFKADIYENFDFWFVGRLWWSIGCSAWW